MIDVDLDELERIAESALGDDWRIVRFHMSGPKIGIDAGDRGICCSYDRWRENEFRFIASANPAVVLELIRRVRAAE